jgi:pimeloyl-ACP methyl ester carboxylesterase
MQKPVVMMWGENDAVVPAANAAELTDYWPQADVYIFPKCGHVPMVEKQVEVQTVARQFMAKL